MSEHGEVDAQERRLIKGDFRRKALVFFIYMVFGPPIGGFATLVAVFLFGMFASGEFNFPGNVTAEDVLELLHVIIWIPMMSLWGYVFGGIQAAMTGLILAAASDLEGRFGYDKAIVATLPPSLFAGIFISKDAIPELNSENGFFILVLTAAGIFASVAVRFLFRRRFCLPRGTDL